MSYVYSDRQAVARLLENLLVGAARPMDSIGHWVDLLLEEGPAPLTSRFLDQLNGEWLDSEPPDRLCERIGGIARRHMGMRHPGWPHLWAHTLRVTGTMVSIAESQEIDPAVGYLAGVLHDVAKLDEATNSKTHEELGAEFASRILQDRFSALVIDQIRAAILKENGSPLGQVLHDADKLDKIGAAGVLRRISTDTDRAWVPEALDRVAEDCAHFPPMYSDRGRALADSKLAFSNAFLPIAQDVASGWRET
ncbi:MAG TPA: HD domain-containing protein [Aggregatilinea sp.]|uniref:HD domain-containing protein n=1 Tax=Aggregatilinea sp. TaxID=2806333 RepID=UPI002CEAB836|nr:HD domain-containing protein [Aggregatilinea sp.]HML22666.1 HD domain-containing protein [Aggregatilinea sp.]